MSDKNELVGYIKTSSGAYIAVTKSPDPRDLLTDLPYDLEDYYSFIEYYGNLMLNGNEEDLIFFAKNRLDIYAQQLFLMEESIEKDFFESKAIKHISDFIMERVKEYNLPIFTTYIDAYLIAYLELRVLEELANHHTYDINYLWLGHENLIYYYLQFDDTLFNEVIFKSYEAKRYEWFLDNGFLESTTYINAMNVLSKYNQLGEQFGLKPDRELLIEEATLINNNIIINRESFGKEYDDLTKQSANLIKSIFAKSQDLNKQYQVRIDLLEEEVSNMKDRIHLLKKDIASLSQGKEDNEIDYNEITTLVNSIVFNELKGDTSLTNSKTEEILAEINRNDEYLSHHSVNDLKSSLALIFVMNNEELKTKIDFSDLAIFPITRVLEREFNRLILEPYKQSKFYEKNYDVKDNIPEDLSKSIKFTQKCLDKRNSATLGNLSHLADMLNNKLAINSSKRLASFLNYLGDHSEEFFELINNITEFKTSSALLDIRQIRNGISHGNDEVVEKLDTNDVIEIFNIMVRPPIELLKKMVELNQKLT